MQSLDIYLTRHYIGFKSTDLPHEKQVRALKNRDPVIDLSELLENLDLPRNTNINLILDQKFIGYHCFRLPTISRRKLNRILEYELADFLIQDTDQYSYDYRFQIAEETGASVGVYVIQTDLIHRLLQVIKSKNLDVRSILPLSDILDYQLRERYHPEDELIVTANSHFASVFVYRNGFLISYADQAINWSVNQNISTESQEEGKPALQELNLKIKAIFLKENSISQIIIDEESESFLGVNSQNELFLKKKTGIEGVVAEDDSVLPEDIHKSRTGRINLLRSNLYILQEIRKHSRKAIASGIILILCCTIYISSLFYSNQVLKENYQERERIYTDTIKRYLPPTTSKSTALQTIEKQVREFKETQEQNKRFVTREYQVSEQLATLSKLKGRLPTLVLNRYFRAEQSIRIQGEIDSFTEYEQLKTDLQNIYDPKYYSIKFNQKSRGEGNVQFTAMIRPVD